MVVQVVFDDGTILEEAVEEGIDVLEIGTAFYAEPGFNCVRVVDTPIAGAIPKMGHYITIE